MSNYCSKGHWENGMKLPCKQYEIEQLIARVRELETDRNQWMSDCKTFHREMEKREQQILSLQAYAEQLQVALQTFIDEHEECTDADDWMAMLCSIEAHHVAEEALSLPRDTSALDAYVAAKVKEAEARTGNKSPCYQIARDMAVRMWERHYKDDAPNWQPLDDFMGVLSQISNMLTGLGNVEELTRQRDLAVEACRKLSEIRYIEESAVGPLREALAAAKKALSTIKGSEVK